MKAIILFTLVSLLHVTNVHADGPLKDKCNHDAHLAKIETTVVREIQKTVDTLEKGAHAYSFHFSPVWRSKITSDLTVYFETVSEAGDKRRGFTAQYNIDANTCAPKFLKMQAMFTDQESPAGLETASPVAEHCNEAQMLGPLHASIVAYLQELYSSINPGENTGNFTFSGVWRVNGAADMTAFFERLRPGYLSTPMTAQLSVDPETCTPKMDKATTFTWLLISY